MEEAKLLTAAGIADGVDEDAGKKYGWPPCLTSPALKKPRKVESDLFDGAMPLPEIWFTRPTKFLLYLGPETTRLLHTGRQEIPQVFAQKGPRGASRPQQLLAALA